MNPETKKVRAKTTNFGVPLGNNNVTRRTVLNLNPIYIPLPNTINSVRGERGRNLTPTSAIRAPLSNSVRPFQSYFSMDQIRANTSETVYHGPPGAISNPDGNPALRHLQPQLSSPTPSVRQTTGSLITSQPFSSSQTHISTSNPTPPSGLSVPIPSASPTGSTQQTVPPISMQANLNIVHTNKTYAVPSPNPSSAPPSVTTSSSMIGIPVQNGHSAPTPMDSQQTEPDPGNTSTSVSDKAAAVAILSFLKKYNLKGTEELFKKEANISENDLKGGLLQSDADVHNVLSSYASDENPDEYTEAYKQLLSFCETTLDAYKFEVGQILWPIFVHLYLELVYNEHERQAEVFFETFSRAQETFHESDIVLLSSITKKEHLIKSENPFKCFTSPMRQSSNSSGLYVIRLSREALSILKRFLQEKRLKIIQNIVQERLYLEIYDGMPRGKAAIHAVAGHIMGEAMKLDNKVKVYYGLLKEPDLQNVQMDEDDDDAGPSTSIDQSSSQSTTSQKEASGNQAQSGNAPAPSETKASKKKKNKKDWLVSKKSKNDPNAPPITRMPLPDLRDVEKMEKAKGLRESAKRVALGPERLPSICFYTVLNGDKPVTCVKWSDDGALMAVGFATSFVKIWSLTQNKLKKLKSAGELADVDHEAEDVLVRMMDDKSGESQRTLRGHSGPVYSIDFSTDKTGVLTASDDGTIRLWSLLTWTCIVVYKGHLFPVWSATFSPQGAYYFASGGHDRCARLWSTDNHQPLRLFAGHYSDVTCVCIHPNSNYVASGSGDKSVRLWDCVSGSCVRLMTGHKGTIDVLAFSVDGRFLASGGTDCKVIVWDLANGGLLSYITLHQAPVTTITFSREGNVMATGGLDNCVRLWDFQKMIEDVISEDSSGATIPPDAKKVGGDNFMIGEYFTKSTRIFSLHFTRRNILLASGPYQP